MSADALDEPVLQDAEEPHLRVEREFADLVEEQRAAAGAFKPACRVSTAPVNCPSRGPNSCESISIRMESRRSSRG